MRMPCKWQEVDGLTLVVPERRQSTIGSQFCDNSLLLQDAQSAYERIADEAVDTTFWGFVGAVFHCHSFF